MDKIRKEIELIAEFELEDCCIYIYDSAKFIIKYLLNFFILY